MKNTHLSEIENFKADIEAIASIESVPMILEIICRTTGMGFAAIARVTEDRWIACAVKDKINFGLLPGGELEVLTTICNEIRQHHRPVIISNVALDTTYVKHHTPAKYGIQSYISFPIFLKNGAFFGTLCAIDPRPTALDAPEVAGLFSIYADLISSNMISGDQLSDYKQELETERKSKEAQELFMAILGHDLLNPINAVGNAGQLLSRYTEDENVRRIAKILNNSAHRMKEMVENVMDFARKQLGERIPIDRHANDSIEEALTQVILETKMVATDVEIATEFDLSYPVNCDARRISQLFSNLLSNAVKHGDKNSPIHIKVASSPSMFSLALSNGGTKIPKEAIANLFKPFARTESGSKKRGLGLGLFIASEIAHAHDGNIQVFSTDEETSFVFTMPNDLTH